MNNIILVNKEDGYTSRDVVNVLSGIFKTKKIGHFGTLDPIAEGLLVVGIGKYTKLGNLLVNDDKEYIATVLVGTSTDTFDCTGDITSKMDSFKLNEEELKDTLLSFKGKYLQEVPKYSAVKVNGKKLYEYARSNKEIDLPKKEVEIKDINLLEVYTENEQIFFKFKVEVSKGTYIRSLINDISLKINLPMCMFKLVRTRQDKFLLDDAYTISDIKNGDYKFLKLIDVLDVNVIEITEDLRKSIENGCEIEFTSDKDILFTKNNEEYFLYKKCGNVFKPCLFLGDSDNEF